MPRRVSQTQLAKDLGVSQALVSLVLNGRKEGINAETYQRIWDHAVSCGYQPRGMQFERLPRRAMLRQVGIILRSGLNIHTQGSYFNHVLHGLHTVLAEQGHAAVFLGSEDGLKRARLRQYFPTGHALQGVVLFGEVKSSFLRLLQDFAGNIVAVSARHTGRCQAQSSTISIRPSKAGPHRRIARAPAARAASRGPAPQGIPPDPS